MNSKTIALKPLSLEPASGSIELDEQIAESTVLTSTTSATPVDLSLMTLTTVNTVAKEYFVDFSCIFANGTREDTFFEIMVDGVVEAERRFNIRENDTVAAKAHIMSFGFKTAAIGNGIIIKVRFYGEGGTVEVDDRNLIIMGVS